MKECPKCKRCYPDETNHCPQDGEPTAPSLLGEPTLDARYLLERRLGQGGMGVVFQARHIFLKTPHAIKVILPDLVGNDPMLTTRFRQEALAAAAIRHQNIIAVTDFGVVRGTMPFLVMEFVKGRSLQDILTTEGAMSPERAWEFISAIAAGVGAAHRQNIVHRDLKPLNIMVQDDVPIAEGVKILDFGLAKIKSGELLGSFIQAQTSGLMGSPFYMAPEQWSDEEPDARADIYSLGVILYQMLAGEVPFKGSSIPSIMKKHLTMPPPSFQSMGVSVPPAVEAVVRHALEKEVSARIDSIPNFLRELHAALNAAPAPVVAAMKETVMLDPNRTIAVTTPLVKDTPNLSATQPPVAQDTNFDASFPSLVDSQPQFGRVEQSIPPAGAEDPETTRVQARPAVPDVVAPSRPVGPGKPMIVDLSPKRKRLPFVLIGAALLVLVLAAVGITAYFLLQPGEKTKPDMVRIEGGSFMMGRQDGPLQETPPHSVTVQTFMMDRTEVTNTEYAEFINETNRAAPKHWAEKKPPFGQELWPVVNVSLNDANDFAAWRSKRDGVTYRLPTEQEWEYAARNGSQNDLYPWGPEWKDNFAVFKKTAPAPVGSLPDGKNRWGVADLLGNVWEWTSSKVTAYPGNPVQIPVDAQNLVTIRGGAYVSDPNRTDLPASSCMRQFVPPTTQETMLGFRLVRAGS
ncbi:MAG TPA: bifunctional serine/threonine-protein kinase/formylglycine-generating enzyme family protein [Pyrinomonadaceae bacterium]|nr:bifunctional serine/threonine-protein kinase/formylglycine-generating enzyme family protein [Pyrinomonadaceae bacterium]